MDLPILTHLNRCKRYWDMSRLTPRFLPKTASTVNTEMMSVEEIHRKLEKGYADIEKGNVEDVASVFAAFRERH